MSRITHTLIFASIEDLEGKITDELEALVSDPGFKSTFLDKMSLVLAFENPSLALSKAQELKECFTAISYHLFIDTFEIDPEFQLQEEEVGIAWKIINQLSRNSLYISESTRLALVSDQKSLNMRAVHFNIPNSGRITVYHVSAAQKTPFWLDSVTEDSHLVRRQCPAPHDKRALAAVTDYCVAVMLLLLVGCTIYGPDVMTVVLDRKRVEAEDTDLTNARITMRWRASGGRAAIIGNQGKLEHNFPFPSGSYDVAVSFTSSIDSNKRIRFRVGDAQHTTSTPTIHDYMEVHTLFKNLKINKGDSISIDQPQNFQGIAIDYLEYISPQDARYDRSQSPLSTRMEDFLRFCGLWYNSDPRVLLWYLLVVSPILSLVIQTLFLSFFRWTIGCRIAGIRIMGSKRGAPGLKAATLRALGHLASIPCFFLGWLWPFLNHGEQNWPDIISKTRVTNRARGDNEK
jgi:hypothetical protein